MANQSPPKAEKDRSERWLLTYADLITLLLIFFIILYVSSLQDKVKFEQISQSLMLAFTGGGKQIMGEAPGPSIIEGKQGFQRKFSTVKVEEKSKMDEIKKQIEALARKEGLQASISVTLEERGVVISIVDRLLFNSGYAALTPQAYQILQGIGKILVVNRDQYVRVEGHTDNVPIANMQFASNWELSASRATNVVRMFIDDVGIDPRLLSAVGYGEFRPIADNVAEEGRAKNRRVEIVVLSSKFSKSESQSQVTQTTPEIGVAAQLFSPDGAIDEVPVESSGLSTDTSLLEDLPAR